MTTVGERINEYMVERVDEADETSCPVTAIPVSNPEWSMTNLHDDSTVWLGLPWNGLFIVFLWGLWKERYNRLFDSSFREPANLLHYLSTYYYDWFQANLTASSPHSGVHTVEHWVKPQQDEVKLNVDAGQLADGRTMIGGVCRNNSGLQLLLQHDCQAVTIESGSQAVISLLHQEALHSTSSTH